MPYYRSFQLIAYQVPTDQALPAGNTYDLSQLALTQPLYDELQPLLAALSQDARSRLARLIGLVDLAMRSNSVVRAQNPVNETTLKVFMVPEFYFRPQQGDPARSYSEADRNGILNIIRRVFTQKALEGWLFVLGTLVWNMKAQQVLDDTRAAIFKVLNNDLKRLARQDVVLNTAIIAVGGHGVNVYDKLHYSGADFIDIRYRPVIQQEQPKDKSIPMSVFDQYANNQVERLTLGDYFEWNRRLNQKEAILLVGDNLRIGIEVCLDHEMGVLTEAYKDFATTWTNQNVNAGPPKLDLQLLTACGMRVVPNKVIVGKGQYILRIDGISNLPDEWKPPFDRSEIQRVVRASRYGALETGAAQDGRTMKPWLEDNVIVESMPLAGTLKLDATNVNATFVKAIRNKLNIVTGYDETQKPLDDCFQQRLAIYRPQRLAHIN